MNQQESTSSSAVAETTRAQRFYGGGSIWG